MKRKFRRAAAMGQFEFLQEQVAEMLLGVNRYNPNNCETLEKYVDAQLAESEYDADANLTLLKLYQLNPDKYKGSRKRVEAVVKVLLKALMALPLSDVTLCKSLIDEKNLDDKAIRSVCELGESLEKCQLRTVWEKLEQEPLASQIKPIAGFRQAIKKFVCHTVNITYVNISESVLRVFLGTHDDKELADIAKAEGWKMSKDGYVYIANQEATVKNKNIQEKIELCDIQDILHVASGRQ